jgi:hydrogenase maturation factor
MVHVGIAISRLDTDEAEETLSLLREMGALEEEARPAADDHANADR